jgi:ribosomal protein S18 acetylase RimI-like enzyme
MKEEYINLTIGNIDEEHICCAISDKKHQEGFIRKKEFLKSQIQEGHVFRKLNQNGKVFIEYGNLEKEFVPIIGKNYLYIYCFWVSGSFKEKGYGKQLLEYAIGDAKAKNKNGICVISSKKKLPFLSDRSFFNNNI